MPFSSVNSLLKPCAWDMGGSYNLANKVSNTSAVPGVKRPFRDLSALMRVAIGGEHANAAFYSMVEMERCSS